MTVISIDEINAEIVKLEAQTQTYQTIERLAALYVVRDHNTVQDDHGTMTDASPARVEGTSPFLIACSGEPVCEILSVMNELMDTVHIMSPKLYDAVMRKLKT